MATIRFLLNADEEQADLPPGTLLLDYLRQHKRLVGTKEGCREGDCGACVVLLGSWNNDEINYRVVCSCLLVLGAVEGKHVVSIEGLHCKSLSSVQKAIVEEGATQCGFCTPGIVVSLTGYLMNTDSLDKERILSAVDGNICRCTGYMSIKRAVSRLCEELKTLGFVERQGRYARLEWLVQNSFLPGYFLEIPPRLKKLTAVKAEKKVRSKSAIRIAGGTDILIQQAEKVAAAELDLLGDREDLIDIRMEEDACIVGASTTVDDIMKSPVIKRLFPRIKDYFSLVSSTPIRSQATVAGNVINASPIGDLIIFFLALDASITLVNGEKQRTLLLKNFFKGYKELDVEENELVHSLSFPLPQGTFLFNFEKVSKRRNLDIASVNSAIQIRMDQNVIEQAHLSAGGVAPIPLYLTRTCQFLYGKQVEPEVIREAADVAGEEISPISDARGSDEYKKRLLRQLVVAHFTVLFPEHDLASSL